MRRMWTAYGLVESGRTGTPSDIRGRPLPWYTYPAIEYLAGLDFRSSHVLEFGAGNSTLWWSARAKQVTSVEVDPNWFESIRARVDPANTSIYLATSEAEFFAPAAERGPFDVIVIDCLWRPESVDVSVTNLAPGGMIILDNSDWLPATHRDLRSKGLIEVNFHGLGPAVPHAWTTSIFMTRDADFWTGTNPPTPIAGGPSPWPGSYQGEI